MLHHLARNPVVQEAIYVDLKGCELEPGKFPPLLRACLKETMRLNPSASANSRILDTDAILSGYHVPKGVKTYDYLNFVAKLKFPYIFFRL